MKSPSSNNNSLINIIKKNLSITSNPNDTIQDVKLQLLHWILIVLNILGIPIVVIGVIEALLLNQHLTAFSYIICYTPFLLALIFRTKISFKILVSMVLVSIYFIGVFNLILYGFSGVSTPMFFVLLVFSTIFFDIKAGLKAVMFCLLPMLFIGLLFIQNKLSLDISLQEINTYPISWLTASVVFVFLGILIIVSFGIIQKKMLQSMQFSKQKADELKRLNLQLYKSEEKFRDLYNNSPNMYVSVSHKDASIIMCNHTLLNKTGYSKEEVIGSPIYKIYHEDCIEKVKKAFQQFVETGEVRNEELILKRKNGSKIFVSLNVDSIRDDNNKIIHSNSSLQDITEHKKNEKEIIEKTKALEDQFKKSEDQRIATLSVLSDLNGASKKLRAEIIERQKAEDQLKATNQQLTASEQQLKLNEKEIKKNLKEKIVLIQEIYHRTKNNMAIISAMLSIQSRHSENKYVKSTFREINNKIQAMSLVHQKLYKAKDLSNINLKDYIEDLVNLIIQSYGVLAEKTNIKFDLQDVKVTIDSAVPFGLIINELISNIFKHAFPEKQKGEIFVRLSKEKNGSINFELTDNGIGFPKNFNPKKDGSMGLMSVFSIVEYQLKGEIFVKSENGLRWQVKITDNSHIERV